MTTVPVPVPVNLPRRIARCYARAPDAPPPKQSRAPSPSRAQKSGPAPSATATAAPAPAAAKKEKESNLINFIFEAFPKPFNCTTIPQTRLFAADPSHPLHIKIQRRVAAHNPDDFIWVARCPTHVSKKPAYRHDVVKKLRRVFREALRQRGYDEQGVQLGEHHMARLKQEPVMTGQRTVAETTGNLSGALSMFYVGDQKRVLMAKGHDIKAECDRILDKVLQIRYAAKKGARRGEDRSPTTARHGKRVKQEWQLGHLHGTLQTITAEETML
ncbi:hypothetical protein Slin15195_G007010 [Septoria linicola]|uniref:Uncharacterized protein n=1 Tax=Septoria linicola TaxID=215465 RepID=A0A9Q9AJT0_9PEZI|nr:hypothetical protein Slin14017_G007020 [Septoria linicola]USW47382.1 hypothetical protein Slin15195_G007010 [Septoria linicola]